MESFLRLVRSRLWGAGALPKNSYDTLAVFYDRMMGHVDYQQWAQYIHTVCKKFGQTTLEVIECACGTGTFAAELEKFGYSLTGFDLSLSMLQKAQIKSGANLFQADLRKLPLRSGVKILLCLYDSILYLREDEIVDLLRNAAVVTDLNGLFIFDVVTENHVLDFWKKYNEFDQTQEWKCYRSGWYDSNEKCQHTEIVLKSRIDKQKWVEHHKQWVYPLNFFAEQALAAGWSVAGCFHEFTLDPGSEDSGRVHFVLRRE